MKAKYRCVRCSKTFKDKPGPVNCPSCDHIYVTWINYPKFRLPIGSVMSYQKP